MGTTSVDPHALRLAARRLDEAADLLDTALRSHLNGLQLSSADGATRAAIEKLVADVARWQRAARESACAVRVGADRYTDDDRRGAAVLR